MLLFIACKGVNESWEKQKLDVQLGAASCQHVSHLHRIIIHTSPNPNRNKSWQESPTAHHSMSSSIACTKEQYITVTTKKSNQIHLQRRAPTETGSKPCRSVPMGGDTSAPLGEQNLQNMHHHPHHHHHHHHHHHPRRHRHRHRHRPHRHSHQQQHHHQHHCWH